MQKLTLEVRNYIKQMKLIEGGETVLAGVSGGADSVCLFEILKELRQDLHFNLEVIHINHMIREAADSEARYVEKICNESDIPFHRRDIDIPGIHSSSSESEEETARRERYRAFVECADVIAASKDAGKVIIATAHNRNDQAETMLHNLFRGSRIKGLSGIRASGTRDGYRIIRPLLQTDRADIEEFLREKGIKWCTDESNLGDAYTRNRIRHNIIPAAEEMINAGAGRHVAEAAEYLSRLDDYIEEQADAVKGWLIEVRSSCKDDRSVLTSDEEPLVEMNVKVLAAQPQIIRERLLMRGIKLLYPRIKDIQESHIRELIKLIGSTEGTVQIRLPYGIRAKREYDRLIFDFSKDKSNIDKPEKIYHKERGLSKTDGCEKGTGSENDFFMISKADITAENPLKISVSGLGEALISVFDYEKGSKIPRGEYTKWFDYDKITNSLQFRKRRTGDYIAIGSGKKTLKKFMIDEKIAAERRDDMYLLADGEHIMWIPGYRISDEYKLTEDSYKVLAVTVTDCQLQR